MASRNTCNTCIQMIFQNNQQGNFFIYLAILALFWFWGRMPLIEMNFQFFVPHRCHNIKQQKIHQSQQYDSSIKGVFVGIFVLFGRIKSEIF